jgi:hypothetical protein
MPFATPVVASRAVATTKGKVAAKVTETIEGLEEVCALQACLKAIEGLLEVKKEALKELATERLLERGLARHAKPDSLSLAEGAASANAFVVKRSTRSPITAEEVEVLESLGAADLVEVIDEQPEMLAVNPAYAHDEALLKRIDKALSGVKGIPADFVVQVPAVSKTVVTDAATDAVFKLPAEVAASVFAIVAGVNLRATHGDMSAAWDIVRPMIAPDEVQVKTMLRASLKASLAATAE